MIKLEHIVLASPEQMKFIMNTLSSREKPKKLPLLVLKIMECFCRERGEVDER